MILPIGHRDGSVRRLPWVTLTLIGVCLLAFLLTDTSAYDEAPDPFGIVAADEPATQGAFHRFGLVPSAPRPHAFLTHMFLHAGWLHLIGNLFLLGLAGPAIEERWGRAAYALFYPLAGVFAGVFYLGLSGDSSVPMVGASGAIAGVLGAFALRMWNTQIRFAYFFLFGLRPVWGTFEAPAWAMLSLWFANEVFQGWLWSDVNTGGGIAYWAHVGGFAFGVGAAALVRTLKIEDRFVNPGVEAQLVRFRANPTLEAALEAREQGDVAGALGMLEAEWSRQPDGARDDEVALALWDAALACARPERGAPALLSALRSAERRGERELALRHWSELSDRVPDARPEPALLLHFVPMLVAEHQPERAALALRQAAHPEQALSPGQALRIVELARGIDPVAARCAARRALESPDLHEAKRAKLEALAESLAGDAEVRSFADALAEPGESIDAGPEPGLGLDPGSAGEADPELEPGDPDLELDSAPAAAAPADAEDPADRSITLARFGHAKLVEARPSALDDDGLRLVLEGEREARVPFAKIQAIAVAVVSGLGPKPVLVIDLIANWNASEAEALRGVRLRSDRFDPRPLVGDARGDAKRAYVELVGRLLEATRAQPLPSIEGALGRPHARFESEAAYAQAVLDVAG